MGQEIQRRSIQAIEASKPGQRELDPIRDNSYQPTPHITTNRA
jgi:hypothetical protein